MPGREAMMQYLYKNVLIYGRSSEWTRWEKLAMMIFMAVVYLMVLVLEPC